MQVLGVLFCVNYISLSGGARAVESCIRMLHFVFALAERRTQIISQSAKRHTKRGQRKREPALLHSSSVWVLHHPPPFFPSPVSPPQILPPSLISLNHISAQITCGCSIFIILTYDPDTYILRLILLKFL